MRKAFLAGMAVAILLSSCATSPKTTSAPVVQKAGSQLTEGQRFQKSREYADQARTKIDRGSNAEGLDLANEAIELDPENGEAYLQAARAYKSFGKKEKVAAAFELALKYSSNTANVMISMAQYYRETGETEKAKQILVDVLAKTPNNAWANREFAYLCENNLGDLDKAISYFLVSIEQGSDDPWIYNDASVAFEKKGDLDKAREFLRKAKAKTDAGQGDQWIKDQVAQRGSRLQI